MKYEDVVTHMKECPSIKPEDFLKEDCFSSPRFKFDPKNKSTQNKVRYDGPASTAPIRRSFVGSKNDFLDYSKVLSQENEAKRHALTLQRKRGTGGSRLLSLQFRKLIASKMMEMSGETEKS